MTSSKLVNLVCHLNLVIIIIHEFVLQEDILSAAKHGEQLLDDFKSKDDMGKEFSERTGNVSSTER